LKRFFEELNADIKTFLKEIALVIALVVAPICMAIITDRIIVQSNYFILFFKGFMWCLIYWGVLYIFILDDEDKNIVKGLARKFCLTK
jgi:hypothetical protein